MRSAARIAAFAGVPLVALIAYVAMRHPGSAPRPDDTLPAKRGPSSAARPNVILISIDTLRADAVGRSARGGSATPTLDRLAREGVRFTTAYSTSSWTPPSMVSLMTSLYPARHGVTAAAEAKGKVSGQPAIPRELPLLAEALQRGGYRTFGIAANGHLAAEFGFARGFGRYACLGFTEAPRVVEQMAAVKAEILGGAAPFFLWVHLFDPHSPYFRYEPWLREAWKDRPRYVDLENIGAPDRYEALDMTGERLAYVETLYEGEVRYSDEIVAGLLADLGAAATDDSIVVIVSDHGEEFGEHGHFGHGRTLYEESVRIPFIIWFPRARFAGRVVPTPVSLVDVTPTLLDALGLPGLPSADGVSLMPLLSGAPAPAREVYAELARGAELALVRRDDWKLIHSVRRPERSMLFHLSRDPREATNEFASERGRAPLTRLLERVTNPSRSASRVPLSDQQIEALKALGYVR